MWVFMPRELCALVPREHALTAPRVSSAKRVGHIKDSTPQPCWQLLSRVFCPSFLAQATQAVSNTIRLVPEIKLDDVWSALETGSRLPMLRDCYYFQHPLKEVQAHICLCISGI